MEITIRSFKKSDYWLLEEIHKDAAGDFDNATQVANFQQYVQYRSNLVKIALNEEEIVGYTIGYQDNPKKARVYSLYVKPTFRGKQIGTKLLNALENEIITTYPELRYLSIRIPQEFFDSVNFFNTKGFDLITKINNYEKADLSFPFNYNTNLIIRPIKLINEDLQMLSQLEKICFSEYWQINTEEFRKRLQLEKSSLFLAFLEEELVGYNYNTLSTSNPIGHYVRIATHPNYRRQGIATSLTIEAFRWFKDQKVEKILLSTYADSDIHNKIYQKWGFQFIDQEMIMAKKYLQPSEKNFCY